MKRYLLSRRMLANLFVLGFLGIWFLTLAPTVIHGPAAYIEVSGHSMDGTYKTGDLILTRTQDSYGVGDIITFKVPAGSGQGQVIHRIIGGTGTTGYTTQGDNNPDPDPWHPTDDDVVGKAVKRFEGKAWMLHLPRQPWFAGVTAGVLTLVVLGIDAMPRRRSASGQQVEEADANPLGEPVETGGRTIPAQRAGTTPTSPAPTTIVEIPRQAAGPRLRLGRSKPGVRKLGVEKPGAEKPAHQLADEPRGQA